MTIKFGSGQTSGQPLAITATAIGGAQVLHTFPAGSATPEDLEVYAFNSNATKGILLTLALYNSAAVLIRSWSVLVPAGASLVPVFDNDGDVIPSLVCNGTVVLKAFAETASVLALTARVNDQAAVVNALTFGSGQTEGLPLVLTAITLGTAQTLHTFPSGTNLCDIAQVFAFNSSDDVGRTLHLALYDSLAALVRQWDFLVGAKGALVPVLGNEEFNAALIMNGTSVLKAYADVASVLAVTARVIDQAAP